MMGFYKVCSGRRKAESIRRKTDGNRLVQGIVQEGKYVGIPQCFLRCISLARII